MRVSIRSFRPALTTAAITLGFGMAMSPVFAEPVSVTIDNTSELQLCAEADNVTLNFSNPAVRAFTIEATHPVYIDTLKRDSAAPDWTACDFGPPTGEKYQPPEKVTVYEDVELSVVGFRFANFWRQRDVPFTVKNRTENRFDLIQVWVRHEERAEEVLVVYPPDGYWRARPLPPTHLGWSAYGSSFLVGPVGNEKGRSVVDMTALSFDPKTRSFELTFEGGASASVAIQSLDRGRQILHVTMQTGVDKRPFAALRSMYVTRFNNDVAEVAVLEDGAKAWREEPIMTFRGAKAVRKLWAGRHVPSRHNTSAPDMLFSGFASGSDATAKR